MIRFNCKGELKKTDTFLRKMVHLDLDSILDRYGKEGVDALASATPRRTGKTAESWSYEIHGSGSSKTITWTNSNINDGVCIAVILQYGHGTRNGGYVQGIDYINPAIRPIFEKIAESAYREVVNS